MVCVPTDSVLMLKDVPVPIAPSMLLVQVRADPVSTPSCGSLAEPVNVTLVPCTTLVPLAGALMLAVGGWNAGAVTVIVIDAVPVAPCESVAVSVMVCVPRDKLLFENDVPVPIAPSMLLVHVNDAPVRTPSSGSLPEPVKVTLVPCTTLVPLAGALIDAVRARFTSNVMIPLLLAPYEFIAL